MPTQTDGCVRELLLALRCKRVPGRRIAEALAEVDSHVADSGQDPREAFGPAKEYAEQLPAPSTRAGAHSAGAASSPPRRRSRWPASAAGHSWPTGRSAWAPGQPGRLGLSALGSAAVGLALLAVTVGVLTRATRLTPNRVLDPRTGGDLAGRMPWWVPLILTAVPFALLLLGAVTDAGS